MSSLALSDQEKISEETHCVLVKMVINRRSMYESWSVYYLRSICHFEICVIAARSFLLSEYEYS